MLSCVLEDIVSTKIQIEYKKWPNKYTRDKATIIEALTDAIRKTTICWMVEEYTW